MATARRKSWSAGKAAGATLGVLALAAVALAVLSALVLEKSWRIDEDRATVFVSFDGHPECGAVFELVNRQDLEAGDIVSGDPAPCENRNLVFRVLQVIIVITTIGTLAWIGWSWIGPSVDGDEKAPGQG